MADTGSVFQNELCRITSQRSTRFGQNIGNPQGKIKLYQVGTIRDKRFTSMTKLSERLGGARGQKSITWKEFSKQVGFNKNGVAICDIAKGYILPSRDSLIRFSEVLEIPLEELILLWNAADLYQRTASSDIGFKPNAALIALVKVAKSSFKYQGFSDLAFITNDQCRLRDALAQGISVKIFLVDPTLENVFKRVLEENPKLERMNLDDFHSEICFEQKNPVRSLL